MAPHQPIDPGPLSRRFDVSIVRDVPVTFMFEASDAECQALATDAGLAGIQALSAAFNIVREGREGLKVTGTVRAQVTQTCVVSLDDFSSLIEEPVDVVFLPEGDVARLATERAAQPANHDEEAAPDDLPDPIAGGRIDLGALAAEILILGLDPYPRKPGVAFVEAASPDDVVSPFAALKQLRDSGSS